MLVNTLLNLVVSFLVYDLLYSMQISLDQYVRNFRIFYQQLIRDHSNEDQLNKKFKLLIEN